ncbi:MAG: hypothetical protein NTV80_04470 [Verrucomicrobia bacterium]|nr:hypothetical protein [Verrucomicrobiota bacterium]
MKLNIQICTLGIALLTAISPASGTITVAVNNSNFSKAGNGVGEFIFEVLQVELAGKADYELVDRKQLQQMLSEQSLGASGLTGEQVAKVGKLVGAKYFIFGDTLQAGERMAVNCRVVQVETGVLKPVLLPVIKDEDPMTVGQKLATQVGEAIAKLEGRSATEQAAKQPTEKLDLPAGARQPAISIRIPETSVTPQAPNADPAAEKSLEAFFLANDFKVVQLSRPSQSVPAQAALHLEGKDHEALLLEARDKGAEILILGIATSDRATQIGNFTAARARIEIAAIRTKDSVVLASSSGYGVGTDLSDFVAEKKAIESATEKVQMGFVKQFLDKNKSSN